jgi:hypothetical protein
VRTATDLNGCLAGELGPDGKVVHVHCSSIPVASLQG